MYTLFIRTFITYILLIGTIKMMGKRQLGDLELSEFVITMLLSELASVPIIDNTVPMLYAVIPIATLLSLEIIVSFAAIKCRGLQKIVVGKPSIIIKKGILDKNEMENVRISLDELLCQLRLKNISDISDVEYAIIEENGQLSVIEKSSAKAVTPKDLGIETTEKGIVHTLIVDGEISDFNLKLSGRSEKWLKNQLKIKKCRQKDVFLFTVDDADSINLIKNGDNK